jgi:hypothetical protein
MNEQYEVVASVQAAQALGIARGYGLSSEMIMAEIIRVE